MSLHSIPFPVLRMCFFNFVLHVGAKRILQVFALCDTGLNIWGVLREKTKDRSKMGETILICLLLLLLLLMLMLLLLRYTPTVAPIALPGEYPKTPRSPPRACQSAPRSSSWSLASFPYLQDVNATNLEGLNSID